MLFTVFWRLDLELRFQPLHILAVDRVEASSPERRDQVQPKDCRLRGNPARLLPIGPCVAVDEARREFL
jgi:hypothetical protein